MFQIHCSDNYWGSETNLSEGDKEVSHLPSSCGCWSDHNQWIESFWKSPIHDRLSMLLGTNLLGKQSGSTGLWTRIHKGELIMIFWKKIDILISSLQEVGFFLNIINQMMAVQMKCRDVYSYSFTCFPLAYTQVSETKMSPAIRKPLKHWTLTRTNLF